ncbi:MAG TPA: GNAT family N-acetyltransferase [Chloroflexi bacterium]|nr:GNAT family N-acetyltransferase [Chloroflexota bacterium]
MEAIQIQELTDPYRGWAARLLEEAWGSTRIVTRGRVHQAEALPGLIALRGDEPVGLLTYQIAGEACEIVTLNSQVEGIGVGSALIEALVERARAAGCARLWLITTNDNLPALRFYQKRGFRLVAVYPDALTESRRLKPEIPPVGLDGIPLRDEIELERPLR